MNKSVLAAAVLSCVASMSALSVAGAAPAVPEPGDSLEAVTEKPAPELDNQLPNPASQKPALRFTLNDIKVEQPETNFDQKQLQAIASKAVGHEITVKDLDSVLWELATYGRSHGYPAAYAYVPEQKAKGGVLIARLALGRYDEIQVDSHVKPAQAERARGLLAGLKSGGVIEEKSLETSLFNVNEMYGVEARGSLKPGSKDGTSNLTVALTPGKKQTATLYADNYGSKSSGRYRYGFQADFMGLGDTDSRFTVGGLLSNNNLHNYNLGWETHVGHSATTLGIRYSRMDYQLGSIFTDLDARGIANTLNIYGKTPLWKTVGSSLSVKYGFAYRTMTDDMRNNGVNIKKHSNVGHVGLEGMLRNTTSGFSMRYDVAGYIGDVASDSQWGDIVGQAGNTLGNFTKGVLEVNALQKLGRDFDLVFNFQGQKSSRNLDSSEQLFLGGPRGVRAYPSGDGAGDEGYLSTLELHYRTPLQGLMFRAYYDMGHVKVARDGHLGGQTLKGWGIGLTYQHPDHYFVKLDYARRIGLTNNPSEDAKSPQRIWFLVGKTW